MRIRHQFLLFTALIGVLVACGDPDRDASNAYRDPAETPRYADADRNGKVSRDEASVDPTLAARFGRYDSDRNGELDRAEFAQLEAGATHYAQTRDHETRKEDKERHTLRPRREFPRPLD